MHVYTRQFIRSSKQKQELKSKNVSLYKTSQDKRTLNNTS